MVHTLYITTQSSVAMSWLFKTLDIWNKYAINMRLQIFPWHTSSLTFDTCSVVGENVESFSSSIFLHYKETVLQSSFKLLFTDTIQTLLSLCGLTA